MGKILIIKGADFSNNAITSLIRINVEVSPSDGGIVTGGGFYNEGDTVALTATPNANYTFRQWSDGIANASRLITAGSSPTTYTALFDYKKTTVLRMTDPGFNFNWNSGAIQTGVDAQEFYDAGYHNSGWVLCEDLTAIEVTVVGSSVSQYTTIIAGLLFSPNNSDTESLDLTTYPPVTFPPTDSVKISSVPNGARYMMAQIYVGSNSKDNAFISVKDIS